MELQLILNIYLNKEKDYYIHLKTPCTTFIYYILHEQNIY